ncbi:MAG: hypothetical protein ACOYEN_08660 [Limnochordia bacterium]|nr:hypothetical protein [Limnochordia bacterium]
MKLKTWQKTFLSMLCIVGAGCILFNLAFILAYLVHITCGMVMSSLGQRLGNARALYFSWHYVYLFFILLLSWAVFRTRLSDLGKAAFSTMPLIVILTEVGIQFYRWPVLVWAIGASIVGAVLLYLYKTKRSWMYYFAVIYVVAVEVLLTLSGTEI